MYDPDTSIIKKFHIDVKKQIYNEYCNNIEYLLDIGSGRLSDAYLWYTNHIKNVMCIEPSLDSIKYATKLVEKYKNDMNIQIINGIGNETWKTNNKYKEIIKHKYDAITLQFTIHYMMKNIDILMKNILSVIKPGTVVIITCMNGNLIRDKLNKYHKIEIRNRQEPVFYIHPMYSQNNRDNNISINRKNNTSNDNSSNNNAITLSNNDILVYFKGAYGVASGSIEPLVDIKYLTDQFVVNGFKIVRVKNFLDYKSKIKNKMSHMQKSVSYYYISLVFKYESFGNASIIYSK